MASEHKTSDDSAPSHSVDAHTLGGLPLVVSPECADADVCVYVRASDHAFSLEARRLLMRVVFAARTMCEALSLDALPGQAVVAAAYRVLVKLGMPCHVQCVYRSTPYLTAHTPEEQDEVDALLQQSPGESCVPYLVLLTPPLETFAEEDAARAADADGMGWVRVPQADDVVTLADTHQGDAVHGWCVSDCVHIDPRSTCVTLGAKAVLMGDDVPSYLMYTPRYTLRPHGDVAELPVELGSDEQRVDAVVNFAAHAPDDVAHIAASLQRMVERGNTETSAAYLRENQDAMRRVQATQLAKDAAVTERVMRAAATQ